VDDIFPYLQLHAGGVSRRSSLRFIFDAGGFAYYVDDTTLVMTTKQLARVKWVSQLEKPAPMGLDVASVTQRRETAFAAGFWRLDPDAWIGPLAKALKDNDRQVCFDAAYALGEFGPQAAEAIDPLVTLLKSKDLTLREGAVFALGKIGPSALEKLLRLVDDADSAIGIAATKSVNVMGSVGKHAVPELIEIAKRRADEEDRCDEISVAISRINPVGSVAALCELLRGENAGIRAFAAMTIAEIGSPGQSCAQELLPLLKDESTRVRINAAYALARVDLPEDFPTAGLEAAVKDSDQHVRLWVQQALRVIKSKKGAP
jgi:HEAT repeat protein